MKKKLLTILLSFSLVLAFASTGVFAISSDSAPNFVWGVDVPSFTQFGTTNYGELLFSFTIPDNFNVSYTPNVDYPIFNNVNMKYRLSGNGSRYLFDISSGSGSAQLDALAWNSVYPATFDVYRLNIGGNDTILCTLHGNPLDRSNGTTLSLTSYLSPSVTFGSSWEWDNLGTVGEWVNFSIKPGYAFVIEGECEILERSYYINNSWSFFGTNNAHRSNGSSERISAIGNIRDGFSVDYGLTRDQLIQWAAQNPNLVGNASIYEFYDSDSVSLSSGSAFFVSYPLYDGVQTTLEGLRSRENSVDLIGSVYLNYSTRPTFRYVALKSNIDPNNKDVAFYNTLQPSITDSSGNVTEGPDGTTISPGDIPSGGGDSSTPPLDEDNSLLGTISKFVNDIKRLLSTAVESINTLVSEGSQFMRTVAQMFTWLPEQLTSLLVAAFTVLVVVGVLKVLWR